MVEPGDLEIILGLLCLIESLDEFKGARRALGALTPGRVSALRRVATFDSVGSSTRMEGCRPADHEVERLWSKLQATRDE